MFRDTAVGVLQSVCMAFWISGRKQECLKKLYDRMADGIKQGHTFDKTRLAIIPLYVYPRTTKGPEFYTLGIVPSLYAPS